MKAQYFVYTRGFDITNDYKLMFSPTSDFCSDEVRKYFLKQVKGMINIEMYDGTLTTPRWLFSRYKGMVLWGMSIMNSELSDVNNKDYANRPVRGFFGMVAKDEETTKLPYDIEFFKNFYKDYVVDLWNSSKEEFKQKGIVYDGNFDGYEVITPNSNVAIELNTDDNKTVICGAVDTKELFTKALTLSDDVSCVSGLDERAHAYNHDYLYYNAIVNGVEVREEKTYVIIPDSIPNPKNPEPSKKDMRLKVVAVVAFIAVIMIIVAMCMRKTPTSKSSPSGEKIINQEETKMQTQPTDSVLTLKKTSN